MSFKPLWPPWPPAFFSFTVPAGMADLLQQRVAQYQAILQAELATAEPALKLTLSSSAAPVQTMQATAQATLINLLNSCFKGCT